MIIIVSYVFLNIIIEHFNLFIITEKNISISQYCVEKLTMTFLDNLNKIKAFSIMSSLRIITTLLRLNVYSFIKQLPSGLINNLKSLYVWQLSYVNWQKDSYSFKILVSNSQFNNDSTVRVRNLLIIRIL